MIVGWILFVVALIGAWFHIGNGGKAAKNGNIASVVWSVFWLLLLLILMSSGIARIIN